MIGIFYKSNDQIATSDNTEILKSILQKDVLWIDLFDPSGDEKSIFSTPTCRAGHRRKRLRVHPAIPRLRIVYSSIPTF